jgi:hypothetical protein
VKGPTPCSDTFSNRFFWSEAVKRRDTWYLSYHTAELHSDFIPNPAVELQFIRRTADGLWMVLLPNGSSYKIKRGHLSEHKPEDQRRIDEDFLRGVR